MFQQSRVLKRNLFTHSVLLTALLMIQATAMAEDCDRACLTGMMSQYLDALAAHDPSTLPLAANPRYTEDGQTAKLGEGIWQSLTARGTFRHDYIDTRKQVAAAHVHFYEGDVQVMYSALLYVKDGKITGIETLVQRVAPGARFQPRELGVPVRGMSDPVPRGKKQSRASMIRTALTYPEGLRVGNFTDGGTPFAAEAYRVENGVITAGAGCGRDDCGMYAQRLLVHPSIISSVAAVDEEMGVVLLWMNFGHTGDSYGAGNALVTFEAFKVWGGEIQAINAFFKGLPISTSRFWPSSDPVN